MCLTTLNHMYNITIQLIAQFSSAFHWLLFTLARSWLKIKKKKKKKKLQLDVIIT